MKKILSILGTVGLTMTSSATVVACGSTPANGDNNNPDPVVPSTEFSITMKDFLLKFGGFDRPDLSWNLDYFWVGIHDGIWTNNEIWNNIPTDFYPSDIDASFISEETITLSWLSLKFSNLINDVILKIEHIRDPKLGLISNDILKIENINVYSQRVSSDETFNINGLDVTETDGTYDFSFQEKFINVIKDSYESELLDYFNVDSTDYKEIERFKEEFTITDSVQMNFVFVQDLNEFNIQPNNN